MSQNHVCHWLNGKSGGLIHWDAALMRTPDTLAFAVDDAHLRTEHPGWNGGWIVVNARECTSEAIVGAIRQGNFYSSQGPEIRAITLADDQLTVQTSPVQFARLVGPGWKGTTLGSFAGPPLETIRFQVPSDWRYAYLEVEDQAGRRAWTNSLFCAPALKNTGVSSMANAEPGQDRPAKLAISKDLVSGAKVRQLTTYRAHGHLPRIVAHRGLSGACPENTLPAFAAAVALGADEIELDLWASCDGELVVCHDPDVDRTSDGHGLIRDLTWARIRELDAGAWHSPAWTGTRFCRLDEVLDAFGGRVQMNIHIKEPGQNGLVVRRARDMAAERGLLDDIYIAGDTDVLEWAVAVAPDVSRCSLAHSQCGARMLDSALKYRCARVQFWNSNFTAADIARAHEHGIACNLFFGDRPDTPDEAVRLCEIGLDAILTNWTTTVLPAVREHEAKSVSSTSIGGTTE